MEVKSSGIEAAYTAGSEGNVTSFSQMADVRWLNEMRRVLGDFALQAMLDQMPPWCIVSQSRGVVFANASFRAIKGERFLPELAPQLARATIARETTQGRVRAGDAQGAPFFLAEVFPIFGSGRESGAAGVFLLDATREMSSLAEARREQSRLLDILRSTSDWVWETDRFGCVSFASERSIEALGLPPSLVRGRRIGDFAASENDRTGIERRMMERRAFRELPFAVSDAEGRKRVFHLSAVPVFDEEGEFAGFRGTATDVTPQIEALAAADRYKAELEASLASIREKNQQLDLALSAAEASSRAKSDFLATMSHELRTPLNAIIGFSETMSLGMFGPLPERYHGYSGDILASARHLLTLIDDILDLARVESASLKIEFKEVSVGNLLIEAYRIIAGRAAAKGVKLEEPRGPLAPVLLVDSTRAVQIVVNLLNNAVKFTPPGGRVGIDVGPRGHGLFALTVWDTGPGVPADKQAVIFEKFEQGANGVLSREQGGIGVGLTIARELSRKLGGDLMLERSDADGSRFVVLLPLA